MPNVHLTASLCVSLPTEPFQVFLVKVLGWKAVLSRATGVCGLDGRQGFRSGMNASVASGTGGKTVIRLGMGATVEVGVQGTWAFEAELVCPFPFSSSEMRMLSVNPTSISGTPSTAGADCFEPATDVWSGASTSLSDGSTSACLGRRMV